MPSPQPLHWNPQETPQPLHEPLRTLGEHYPLVEQPRGRSVAVTFRPDAKAGTVHVTRDPGGAIITYDQPLHALRGVGTLLSGIAAPGQPRQEQTPFQTLGIMIDCSRNAVMTVEHVKGWLRQLALLGFNTLLLYTEDTYEITDEPCFGYLRGRYSQEELRAIDRYAGQLGVEVVGCIQTLGHLEQILRWPRYAKLKDVETVLLVDDEQSYDLIEKMVATAADCFQSRRVHIGMDEAHGLGTGAFLQRFGHERAFDIFNRHLGRVLGICERHGLRPMIWSDMYFRMGSATNDYYDLASQIPDDVVQSVPQGVDLVYWDYYHADRSFYREYIQRHRRFGRTPVVASGIWTWPRFWYDASTTEANALPLIAACREQQVEELFFTLWGDDGGFCEYDAALAGIALAAEHAYSVAEPVEADVASRFAAVCGGDYQAVVQMGELTRFESHNVLWDDPLLGIWWNAQVREDKDHWPKALAHYQAVLASVEQHARTTRPIDLAHGVRVLRCLVAKVDLGIRLRSAYARGDTAELARVREAVPGVQRSIDQLLRSLRRQWMHRNKPEGFEVLQIRFAGLRERYRELRQRLADLEAGRVRSIPELEQTPCPIAEPVWWRSLASGSVKL